MLERMTLKNPGDSSGYRICLDEIKEFKIMHQGDSLFLYGDIADRLGELEDKKISDDPVRGRH